MTHFPGLNRLCARFSLDRVHGYRGDHFSCAWSSRSARRGWRCAAARVRIFHHVSVGARRVHRHSVDRDGTSVERLTFGSPNRVGFAVSMALAASYAVLMIVQRRMIASRPKVFERLRSRLAEIKSIVPHTLRERRIWTLAAITAGCCEEVFFRGYLLTFMASFGGMIAAVAVCAVLFGLYHAYFGPAWHPQDRRVRTAHDIDRAVVWIPDPRDLHSRHRRLDERRHRLPRLLERPRAGDGIGIRSGFVTAPRL